MQEIETMQSVLNSQVASNEGKVGQMRGEIKKLRNMVGDVRDGLAGQIHNLKVGQSGRKGRMDEIWAHRTDQGRDTKETLST